ncbi:MULTISPECIES: metal-sulfur cluster assembly factor [unclassified Spirillospora]|uniref:metal-sulfur cluster assembly factor n=1 Tax=unclassified Spirillospora TaxID=2642701 RepID=UPI00371F516C
MTERGTADPAAESPPVASWLGGDADAQLLREMLYEVIDPELGVNIVDLGLVYGVEVTDRVARVRMTMTTPACPLSGYFEDTIRSALWGTPGVDDVDTEFVWEPVWEPDMMTDAAKHALGWR